jgi:hypothetical protein
MGGTCMKNHLMKLLAIAALASASANAQTATVSTTDLAVTGFNFTTGAQAASETNYFRNDGKTAMVIHNRQGSPVTATIVNRVGTVDVPGFGPLSLSDQAVTVPSASVVLIGPFAINRFNSGGLTRVNLTSSTLISITTLKVGK